MQVNTGPVSQDGQGPANPALLGRPYDQKSIAIDSQLLQQAHHQDDHAQALAAAAAQQSDRSTEYAIQQLQGYSQIKDDHHNHPQHHPSAMHNHQSTLHNHHGHPGHPQHHPQHHQSHDEAQMRANGLTNQMVSNGLPNGLGSTLGSNVLPPGMSSGLGPGMPNGMGPNGMPNGLGNGLTNSLGQNVRNYVSSPSSPAVAKPAVGSEEYYRIKKYNHKEVERRRRETINKGIDDLGKVVPDCDKHKGQILARAVDYIKMLKDKEETLMKQLTLEKLISEQSINEMSSTNKSLKAELAQAWKELEHYKLQAERQAENN